MSASRRHSRFNRTWRASGDSTSWSRSRAGAASPTSKSSTTISAGRRVAPSSGPVSIGWSRRLCAGQVGAVLCLDASRLARNGRDWHHLLELCGLVEARVIDLDGVYDPCRPNDRLLLGMKGSISEFELGIIRSRMYEAARSKARRGELQDLGAHRLHMGPTYRSRPRSGSPASGGDQADFPEVPRAGQRPAGAAVDGIRRTSTFPIHRTAER